MNQEQQCLGGEFQALDEYFRLQKRRCIDPRIALNSCSSISELGGGSS
jgi:hypothetical protein